jgi:hypothetical protein
MFGGQADNMMPKKIDPRVVAIIFALAIVGGFTLVGDRVAFIRAPKNAVEMTVALPTTMFYHVLGERFYANMAASILWTVLVLSIGAAGYHIAVRKIIEPMVIKNMIETKRREKELLNKYGDDTL